MSNIRKCPNCIQSASEAYQQGFADAMKLYQEEIIKAQQLRPIQFIVPENTVQQPLYAIKTAHNRFMNHMKTKNLTGRSQ